MAQFFLKIAHLSFSMGPTPILKMAVSYGLHPRLWLLMTSKKCQSQGAMPFYIHTPPMEEVNQNVPPKKSKIKSADTCPPLRNCLNSLFPSEKSQFFSKPPRKYSKDQRRRRSDPLRNDDQGPLRKSLPSGGVWILNGMAQVGFIRFLDVNIF